MKDVIGNIEGSTYRITKMGKRFSSAHRLEGHKKCQRIHGHNYTVDATVETGTLVDGMVMDFGVLSAIMNEIVDQMDHKFLASYENVEHQCPYTSLARDRGELYVLYRGRSTAECIADHIAALILQKLAFRYNVILVEVTVWETETSKATIVLVER